MQLFLGFIGVYYGVWSCLVSAFRVQGLGMQGFGV